MSDKQEEQNVQTETPVEQSKEESNKPAESSGEGYTGLIKDILEEYKEEELREKRNQDSELKNAFKQTLSYADKTVEDKIKSVKDEYEDRLKQYDDKIAKLQEALDNKSSGSKVPVDTKNPNKVRELTDEEKKAQKKQSLKEYYSKQLNLDIQ